jgi:hypothetical protein
MVKKSLEANIGIQKRTESEVAILKTKKIAGKKYFPRQKRFFGAKNFNLMMLYFLFGHCVFLPGET